MFENFMSILPVYLMIGLFLSWLIWAHYFNNQKYGLGGKTEPIILILQIFLIIFVFIFGYLYLLLIAMSLLLVINISWVTLVFSNLNYILVVLYSLLLLFFILLVDTKQKKKDLKEFLYGSSLFFVAINLLIVGLFLGNLFSAYNYQYFINLCVIAVLTIVINLLFNIFLQRLFDEKKFIYNPFKFSAKNNNKKVVYSVFIIIILLFAFISFFTFPRYKDISEKNIEYEILDENKIYLHKSISHEVKSFGINTFISNWFPIDARDINIHNLDKKD